MLLLVADIIFKKSVTLAADAYFGWTYFIAWVTPVVALVTTVLYGVLDYRHSNQRLSDWLISLVTASDDQDRDDNIPLVTVSQTVDTQQQYFYV